MADQAQFTFILRLTGVAALAGIMAAMPLSGAAAPASATQTAQKPAKPERQAYVYLAHRPGKKAYNVVMVYAGYPYAAGSAVKIEIGRREFELFTHRETAWAGDAKTDDDLDRAMRLGPERIVRSTPVDGPASTDTYSLAGIAKAVDRINLACPRDRRR